MIYTIDTCGSSKYIDTRFCMVQEKLVTRSELFGVRCCSDTVIPTWIKRKSCKVWANSNMNGCHLNKTWLEAKAVCEEAGARLCTTEEMVNDCTRATGCGLSKGFVWTSSFIIASSKEPANASL